MLAIVVARPAALAVSFLGSHLSRTEQFAAMRIGPEGFASVVYGLLVLQAGTPAGDEAFHLAALTIVLSIFAHSSTDTVIALIFNPSPPPGTKMAAVIWLGCRRAEPKAQGRDRRRQSNHSVEKHSVTT